MSENKTIAKNSIILYIRLIITSIIGLLASRFILQALGASDYGLYNIVGGIVFLMAFLNNVMTSTTYRYIAFELGAGDANGVNRVFNISLVIHILIAILAFSFAETVGIYYIKNYLNIEFGKLDDALFVFRLSVFSTLVSILSVPYQGLIVAKEKFSATVTIEIFRSCLALGAILFVLCYAGNRLRLYALLIAIISIVPSLLYFLYSRYRYLSIIKWNFQKEKSQYKEMIGFSGWIMFGAAACAGEIQGVALIINLFFGTVLNASFGIANQVNHVVKMFAQNLNSAAIPQITKSYSGGNTDRTMQLVVFSSKYSFLLLLLPSLPILLETDFILKLWLKEVPEYTSIFIKLMIVNSLITNMSAAIPAVVHATGKIKYFQLILSTLLLMGLPASYFLLKLGFPPYVLPLSYIVIAIINLFVMQILLKRIVQFDIMEFFYKAYFKMIMVAIAISPLFLLENIFEPNMLRFVGITLLSVFWLLTAIYLLGMGKIEKETIGNHIRKFVSKYYQRVCKVIPEFK